MVPGSGPWDCPKVKMVVPVAAVVVAAVEVVVAVAVVAVVAFAAAWGRTGAV